MKNNVLGWILFLPAAILANIVALKLWYYINLLSNNLMGWSSEGWFARFFEAVTNGIVSAGVLVFIGAIIVPKYNKQVAFILVVLHLLFVIYNIVLRYSAVETGEKIIMFIFAFASLLTSYNVAFYFVELEERASGN